MSWFTNAWHPFEASVQHAHRYPWEDARARRNTAGRPRTVEGQLADGDVRLVVRDVEAGVKPVVAHYAETDLCEAAVSRSRAKVLPHP